MKILFYLLATLLFGGFIFWIVKQLSQEVALSEFSILILFSMTAIIFYGMGKTI